MPFANYDPDLPLDVSGTRNRTIAVGEKGPCCPYQKKVLGGNTGDAVTNYRRLVFDHSEPEVGSGKLLL
jgi:hypothetical protein